MKKTIIFIMLVIFLLQTVSAIDIEVKKESSDEVLIRDLIEPIIFDLKVKNSGPSDDFRFYNLIGFEMIPNETIHIEKGETKDVQLLIFPRDDFDFEDNDSFYYFIRSQSTSEEKQNELIFRALNIEDAFEIGSEGFSPESDSVKIFVKNKVNFNFKKLDMKFNSRFFENEDEKSFSLKSYERKEFDIKVEKDKTKEVEAGFYTLTAEIDLNEEIREVEGNVNFIKTEILNESNETQGFIVFFKIIEKTNEGNIPVNSTTEIKKNIISRFFTSFSEEPDSVERRGFRVYYIWKRQINPGDTLRIETRTNWIFPLFLIIFIAAVIILSRIYYKKDLDLKKKISPVKTKGGEFALKVSIFIEAKNSVEKVKIADRLPVIVKIHEKFGSEKPIRINMDARTIEWEFDKLDIGERKVLSYIVYSKVGVLGKFELPSAKSVYEKQGNSKNTESNKAFFLSETKKKEDNV